MPLPERVRSVPVNLVDVEDQLFNAGLVKVVVDVTPEWRSTPQGDLILRGFIGEKEIEVVFPGRRRSAATQLTLRLKETGTKLLNAAKASGRVIDVSNVRQKLYVDGVWRARMLAEQEGLPVRRFQLVAARWRFRGADGIEHVDGEIPYG